MFLIGGGSSNVFAEGRGDPHHTPEESIDYDITNYVSSNGQAALAAMAQIHPSENISGLQFGGGLARAHNRTGGALGAAFNFKGMGLVNGSLAKEGKDTIWGVGFNFNLKP